MRLFTTKDVISYALNGPYRIPVSFDYKAELLHSPLVWQERGLQQTASGYGAKLTTQHKISYNGRLYRIYATCYSNVASHWFTANKQRIYIR